MFKLKVKESLQHTYNGEEAHHCGSDGSEKDRNWQRQQNRVIESSRSHGLHTSSEASPIEDEHRVRDIIRDHKTFVRKQVKLAEEYLERKHQLSTVSSKHSIHNAQSTDDDSDNDACGGQVVRKKPAVEGRGVRTVPSAVKNRRRKLKKKRAKERGLTGRTCTDNTT